MILKIKHCVCKEDYVWNPSTCACEIDEYLKNYAYMKSLIKNTIIRCDSNIDTPHTLQLILLIKIKTQKDYYIFHTTFLVAIVLLLLTVIWLLTAATLKIHKIISNDKIKLISKIAHAIILTA